LISSRIENSEIGNSKIGRSRIGRFRIHFHYWFITGLVVLGIDHPITGHSKFRRLRIGLEVVVLGLIQVPIMRM
jgi:hypothetical protein